MSLAKLRIPSLFIKEYLDPSYMISTTCLSYNTWNIKTINFKQDIALISFIKDYTSKEFAFKKLLKLSKEKKLKNSLLLVYVKDVKEIYYVISTLEALSIQELLRNSKGLKKIFNSVLIEEGYIFLRNSSKNSKFLALSLIAFTN